MRNPDPKPGRWVLPLVVLGMVVFTYYWINRLGTDGLPDQLASTTTVETTVPSSPADTENGTEVPEETTSTTSISPEIERYLNDLEEDKAALAALLADANMVNQDWEEGNITYQEAQDEMVALGEQAEIFSDDVELHRPAGDRPGLTMAHDGLVDLAGSIATAADGMLTGLRSSDPGDIRKGALLEFRAATASFNEQVDQIIEIALQGTGR